MFRPAGPKLDATQGFEEPLSCRAAGGTRTHMPLRTGAFEAPASADCATAALMFGAIRLSLHAGSLAALFLDEGGEGVEGDAFAGLLGRPRRGDHGVG